MERMQPPPNYYGPYPMQDNTYPPYQSNENMSLRNDVQNETYETFNRFVHSNIGKMCNVHCSFTDSTKWHDKEFIGLLASAGDNYIVVFDNEKNHHILIVGVYIDFIEFFDKVVIG